MARYEEPKPTAEDMYRAVSQARMKSLEAEFAESRNEAEGLREELALFQKSDPQQTIESLEAELAKTRAKLEEARDIVKRFQWSVPILSRHSINVRACPCCGTEVDFDDISDPRDHAGGCTVAAALKD